MYTWNAPISRGRIAHWCLSKRFSVFVHVVIEVMKNLPMFGPNDIGSGASKRTQKLSQWFDALYAPKHDKMKLMKVAIRAGKTSRGGRRNALRAMDLRDAGAFPCW